MLQYFHIWANSGHNHQTDRTFQRCAAANVYCFTSANDRQAANQDDVCSKRRG